MFQRAWNVRVAVPAGSVTCRDSEWSRSSPVPEYHCFEPANGAPFSVTTGFLGSGVTTPCALALLYSCGPRSSVRVVPAGTTS